MIKIICVTYPLVPCNGTAPRHLRQAGLRNLRIKEDIFIEVNFTITGYKVPERQLIKQGYQKNGQKSLIGNFSLILS